jgi:hypothetical protein
MSFKLYISDVNYNIIQPVDLDSSGVEKITLDYGINKASELKVIFTTYLDTIYDYLLSPEACLVLEFDNIKIGFSKANNIITDILPYANIGSGSDFSSCIRLDNFINSDSKYSITNNFLSDSKNRIATYLKNNTIVYQKQYFRIKPFNFSNLTELNISNEKQAKTRLYNEATNYLAQNQGKISIDAQIKRQNGVVEMTFYSSSLDLNTNQRTITANLDYNDLVSNLSNQIDSNKFIFEVLDDVKITLNTGMYSNFELLNEICKNRKLSWREVGLIGNKTKIQIGNFDNLLPTEQASNSDIDNPYNGGSIRIAKVTEYYPTLKVELDINKYILPGENISIDYAEYQEDIDGSLREIFNFQKIQNFNGGTLELYKLQ